MISILNPLLFVLLAQIFRVRFFLHKLHFGRKHRLFAVPTGALPSLQKQIAWFYCHIRNSKPLPGQTIGRINLNPNTFLYVEILLVFA